MKNPNWWEEPPEDEPEKLTEVPCEGVGDFDRFFEIEIEKESEYWERIN